MNGMAEQRPDEGRVPKPQIMEREAGSGTTWGECIVDAMEESELRPFAQTRHLGTRSGVWNYCMVDKKTGATTWRGSVIQIPGLGVRKGIWNGKELGSSS